MTGRAPRRPRDRGSVTAELAVALPAVVVVLALVLTVGAASVARLRAVDAASAAARSAALHEDDAAQRAAAVRVGGDGTSVRTSQAGEWVTADVEVPVVGRLGPFGSGPLRATAHAVARVEP